MKPTDEPFATAMIIAAIIVLTMLAIILLIEQ
jgi:hypothetical protein